MQQAQADVQHKQQDVEQALANDPATNQAQQNVQDAQNQLSAAQKNLEAEQQKAAPKP